uniref:EF-hand domain-containing protein n=1 Tax=viral metagenome TaxID=1070528 RepID=A0A6M3M2X9_9ZZZZ
MLQLVNNPKNDLIERCCQLVKDKTKGRISREEFYLAVDRIKREVDSQVELEFKLPVRAGENN